ncbi:ABC transporter ATP-binding protein [Azospirillum sp. TSO22-1]|uniref:ABC transporter ATP-binding protein n=1 Tax=Azospirillum sp. TSO22-1 TaxID=716789 RepID=UPI000D659C79|nr:ABC transporter ATP-binding protein [Azospirillum sp. TSO22-1]
MTLATERSLPLRPGRPGKVHVVRGALRLEDVTVRFGADAVAVSGVSLTVEPGEFVCLLGPSGCGKSTLLNAVAGYVEPSEGRIRLDGAPVAGPGPDRGMVFQQYSLFPWKSVLENVAFGPRMSGHGRAEARLLAGQFLDMVGLSGHARRYPAELSGGMQQRVSIARALANYPAVLLMDEPFGALDAQTRAMMQEALLSLWGQTGTTVLFVTHDIDEALFLADRVVVMGTAPGRIVADLPVALPRPRHADLVLDPAFLEMKRRCLELIRRESLKAFDGQAGAGI